MQQQHSTTGGRLERIAPRRPQKLQICLSSEEREHLSERARSQGFESVAQFVRARTLSDLPPAA